jgi:cellobiose-specific phosphotransferase system component IIC
MSSAIGFLNKHVVPPLNALSDNLYLSAIRAGMVAIVPLTIIGGLFMVISFLPVSGWDKWVEPYLPILQIPVTATFGLLGVFVCFAIAYDFGKRLQQEPMVSASMATLVFLMLQLETKGQSLVMDGLGSKGLFTAILIALIAVRVQKFLSDRNLVIKMPDTVPPVVYESFLSLIPMCFLVVVFWLIRFRAGGGHQPVGADGLHTLTLRPQHVAGHPGVCLFGDPFVVGRASMAITPWMRSSLPSFFNIWPRMWRPPPKGSPCPT